MENLIRRVSLYRGYAVLFAIAVILFVSIPDRSFIVDYVKPFDTGEIWIYPELNRGGFNNYWFPFFPVTLALFQYHIPQWSQIIVYKLLFVQLVIFAFIIGRFVQSELAGVVAAVMVGGLAYVVFGLNICGYDDIIEQLLLSAALLMFICVSVMKFKDRDTKFLMLSFAFAIALFIKGTIVVFLPVFIGYLYLSGEDIDLKRCKILLSVPLLVIIVNATVNFLCNKAVVFLENPHRAGNIVTGAMGLISTVEGDWKGLAGLSDRENILLWASGEILAHPLRFINAVGGRFYYLFESRIWVFGNG